MSAAAERPPFIYPAMLRMRAFRLALAAALCGGLSAGAQVTLVDIEHGGTGYAVYRIPALAVTTRGTLIAAYDGRPGGADLPSNIALLARRSTDGGRTWGERQVVRSAPGGNGYGDPSLLVDRATGRVFLFHAASVNQGFAGSGTGNADSDPDILHADVSVSDDDGITWNHRRITSRIKHASWGGLFASSGEGIQLRFGVHAGRLIQQYVVRRGGENFAVSVYSDDHGETWSAGQLVGPGLDENKTVEMSDGTIALNSRARPARRVAVSQDGGVTYGIIRVDSQLADPGNNGSLIRAHAESRAPARDAQWLLFSNTDHPTDRVNLTVKLSCDDGRTWSGRRVIEPGAAGYSTLSMLPDGSVGLLYERGRYEHITFARFPLNWIGTCGPERER